MNSATRCTVCQQPEDATSSRCRYCDAAYHKRCLPGNGQCIAADCDQVGFARSGLNCHECYCGSRYQGQGDMDTDVFHARGGAGGVVPLLFFILFCVAGWCLLIVSILVVLSISPLAGNLYAAFVIATARGAFHYTSETPDRRRH